MNHKWPDDRVEAYKAAYAEGLSHSRLALMFGVSRNSSIGKAHRLGLASRAPDYSGGAKSQRRRPKHVFPRSLKPVARPIASPETHVSLLSARDNQCHYIIGELSGAETICCGAPGRPWCNFHAALTCRPITKADRVYVPRRVAA